MALAALLARRHGVAAARQLTRSARAWLSDPANEPARRELVGQLRGWTERAGGAAGRLSGRIAREIERRRVTPAAWERDLMQLRYEIADLAPGPTRDAAIAAYANQLRAGVHLIGTAQRPAEARRQVLAAIEAEERMLRGERLTRDERARTEEAIAAARRAVAGETAPERRSA